jgi:tRNA-dihydrouridine synthase
LRKLFKAYANGFKGAKELRMKLMEAKNAEEVKKIISNFKI